MSRLATRQAVPDVYSDDSPTDSSEDIDERAHRKQRRVMARRALARSGFRRPTSSAASTSVSPASSVGVHRKTDTDHYDGHSTDHLNGYGMAYEPPSKGVLGVGAPGVGASILDELPNVRLPGIQARNRRPVVSRYGKAPRNFAERASQKRSNGSSRHERGKLAPRGLPNQSRAFLPPRGAVHSHGPDDRGPASSARSNLSRQQPPVLKGRHARVSSERVELPVLAGGGTEAPSRPPAGTESPRLPSEEPAPPSPIAQLQPDPPVAQPQTIARAMEGAEDHKTGPVAPRLAEIKQPTLPTVDLAGAGTDRLQEAFEEVYILRAAKERMAQHSATGNPSTPVVGDGYGGEVDHQAVIDRILRLNSEHSRVKSRSSREQEGAAIVPGPSTTHPLPRDRELLPPKPLDHGYRQPEPLSLDQGSQPQQAHASAARGDTSEQPLNADFAGSSQRDEEGTEPDIGVIAVLDECSTIPSRLDGLSTEPTNDPQSRNRDRHRSSTPSGDDKLMAGMSTLDLLKQESTRATAGGFSFQRSAHPPAQIAVSTSHTDSDAQQVGPQDLHLSETLQTAEVVSRGVGSPLPLRKPVRRSGAGPGLPFHARALSEPFVGAPAVPLHASMEEGGRDPRAQETDEQRALSHRDIELSLDAALAENDNNDVQRNRGAGSSHRHDIRSTLASEVSDLIATPRRRRRIVSPASYILKDANNQPFLASGAPSPRVSRGRIPPPVSPLQLSGGPLDDPVHLSLVDDDEWHTHQAATKRPQSAAPLRRKQRSPLPESVPSPRSPGRQIRLPQASGPGETEYRSGVSYDGFTGVQDNLGGSARPRRRRGFPQTVTIQSPRLVQRAARAVARGRSPAREIDFSLARPPPMHGGPAYKHRTRDPGLEEIEPGTYRHASYERMERRLRQQARGPPKARPGASEGAVRLPGSQQPRRPQSVITTKADARMARRPLSPPSPTFRRLIRLFRARPTGDLDSDQSEVSDSSAAETLVRLDIRQNNMLRAFEADEEPGDGSQWRAGVPSTWRDMAGSPLVTRAAGVGGGVGAGDVVERTTAQQGAGAGPDGMQSTSAAQSPSNAHAATRPKLPVTAVGGDMHGATSAQPRAGSYQVAEAATGDQQGAPQDPEQNQASAAQQDSSSAGVARTDGEKSLPGADALSRESARPTRSAGHDLADGARPSGIQQGSRVSRRKPKGQPQPKVVTQREVVTRPPFRPSGSAAATARSVRSPTGRKPAATRKQPAPTGNTARRTSPAGKSGVGPKTGVGAKIGVSGESNVKDKSVRRQRLTRHQKRTASRSERFRQARAELEESGQVGVLARGRHLRGRMGGAGGTGGRGTAKPKLPVTSGETRKARQHGDASPAPKSDKASGRPSQSQSQEPPTASRVAETTGSGDTRQPDDSNPELVESSKHTVVAGQDLDSEPTNGSPVVSENPGAQPSRDAVPSDNAEHSSEGSSSEAVESEGDLGLATASAAKQPDTLPDVQAISERPRPRSRYATDTRVPSVQNSSSESGPGGSGRRSGRSSGAARQMQMAASQQASPQSSSRSEKSGSGSESGSSGSGSDSDAPVSEGDLFAAGGRSGGGARRSGRSSGAARQIQMASGQRTSPQSSSESGSGSDSESDAPASEGDPFAEGGRGGGGDGGRQPPPESDGSSSGSEEDSSGSGSSGEDDGPDSSEGDVYSDDESEGDAKSEGDPGMGGAGRRPKQSTPHTLQQSAPVSERDHGAWGATERDDGVEEPRQRDSQSTPVVNPHKAAAGSPRTLKLPAQAADSQSEDEVQMMGGLSWKDFLIGQDEGGSAQNGNGDDLDEILGGLSGRKKGKGTMSWLLGEDSDNNADKPDASEDDLNLGFPL